MADDDLEAKLDAAARAAYDEITSFYTELNGESARAAAILAVAQIENEITKIIRRYFPANIKNDVWKRIFEGGAPLAGLKNKTNIAEAFGAFGKETRVAIEKMATIRNKFAHRTDVRAFKHPDVFRHCELLGSNPIFPYTISEASSEAQVRIAFITTAKCLHERLEMIAPNVVGLGDPNGPLP